MIVRSLSQLDPKQRVVAGDGWISRRLLLHGDGMGFSLHDTVIQAGAELEMHYARHLEAVYVIEGTGTLTDAATGAVHSLGPGTVYALNDNDRHVLCAHETLRTVCVFNPPLLGPESHDASGAYPLLAPVEAADADTSVR